MNKSFELDASIEKKINEIERDYNVKRTGMSLF